MKTILLNVYENEVKEIDIERDLSAYYKALDCSSIDIVERKIGGKWFCIMCDDEGLLIAEPMISAINDMGEPMLVGNLMFFHSDDEGNLVGLSEDDLRHIKKYIMHLYTRKHPEGYSMLTQCEYN